MAQPLPLAPADRRADPIVEPASANPAAALSRLVLAPGLTASVWAAEPMLANPRAISFDEQGRLYVAETHRYRTSALDIRDYPFLLERDLASRTVEDRARLLEEGFGGQVAQLAIESERIRLIEDTDRDGVADTTHVFAADFNSALDGTASGILAWGNQVWLAKSPALSRLTPDSSGTRAATRGEIHRGFGVHLGFAGHDLHGPIVGPDGKLYFAAGDRGAHIESRDGKIIDVPDTGAVFRCNPDGSALELVATGLRNPGGLAFDDFGNLFASDSASGNGDHARLVHVIEGGDSGWRNGYQHPFTTRSGPWMRDGLWQTSFPEQPAYVFPPVASIAPGPAGLAFYPGTGLTPEYAGRFFVCHLNHNPADSGILTYALRAQGAGFTLSDSKSFLRGAMPTDVTFGPDNRLYFSDWVSGWPYPKSQRGRIYAVDSSNRAPNQPAQHVTAAARSNRSPTAWIAALGHSDRRERLAAQFELVGRGAAGLSLLQTVAENTNASQLSRLHAIWGMGQLAHSIASALNQVPLLLSDKDSEVRAQAAKVLGDAFRFEAFRPLVAALQDNEPRVAFFAAQSLGKIKRPDAIRPLLVLLKKNDDRDIALRQAIVVAVARLAPDPILAQTVNDESRAVRLGGLLAYRRLADPMVASFLNDFDPYVVREAARAINDVPIEAAMPALAALLDVAPLDDDVLVLRVLNAHGRIGGAENAKALGIFAARPHVPARFRAEALRQLAQWATLPVRDRVTGLHRPMPPRDAAPATDAMVTFLKQLDGKTPEEVQIAMIETVADLRVEGVGHALWDTVFQPSRPLLSRIAALQSLEKLKDPRLEVAAIHSGRSDAPELAQAAVPILSRRLPGVSIPVLKPLALSHVAAGQAAVYQTLGGITDPRADEIVTEALDRLGAGQVPLVAQAELLDLAKSRPDPAVVTKVRQLESDWQAQGGLAPFRSALEGGSAIEGRRLFERHAALACLKCHEPGQASAEAGPDLTGIGARQTREQILESIVLPKAKVAPGFERAPPMPEGVANLLSRKQLRDLVAYLVESKARPEALTAP